MECEQQDAVFLNIPHSAFKINQLIIQTRLIGVNDSSFLPSTGVGEGVGTGEGDSVSWSRVPRFFPSRDLAMTI